MKLSKIYGLSVFCFIALCSNSAHSEEKKNSEFAPLGDFHVGATAGIGLPTPFSGQALVKYKNLIGVNAEYGFLPEIKVPISEDLRVKASSLEASFRLYPFRGSFFLGCGFGSQKISASATVSEMNVRAPVSAETTTTFLSPRIGFLHRFDFGLSLGMDVGVQVPLSGKTDFSVPEFQGKQLSIPAEVTDASRYAEKTWVPIVHILQLGYVL